MVDMIELNNLRSQWEDEGRPDKRYLTATGTFKFLPDKSYFLPWEPDVGGHYDRVRLEAVFAGMETILVDRSPAPPQTCRDGE